MGIRAVVFDFYGTLARNVAETPGVGDVLADHGYRLPDRLGEIWWNGDLDGVEHLERSRSRDHYVAWQHERLLEMLAAADVHPGEYETILAKLRAGDTERRLEAYPEVPRALEAVRALGLRLAICSNWDWDLEPAVAEAGLAGAVDLMVSSAWVGARKPHPRIYGHTLERLGVTPGEVLFVGDTWGPDVVGPIEMGMTPVYLERAGHWPDATAPFAGAGDAGGGAGVTRARDLDGVLDLL